MPIRVQRKRTKGWQMPQNTVYVGRPTKWGNPFTVDDCGGSVAEAVECFRSLVVCGARLSLAELRELRGKNLACWCPLDQPCHADVLLELANTPEGL